MIRPTKSGVMVAEMRYLHQSCSSATAYDTALLVLLEEEQLDGGCAPSGQSLCEPRTLPLVRGSICPDPRSPRSVTLKYLTFKASTPAKTVPAEVD